MLQFKKAVKTVRETLGGVKRSQNGHNFLDDTGKMITCNYTMDLNDTSEEVHDAAPVMRRNRSKVMPIISIKSV